MTVEQETCDGECSVAGKCDPDHGLQCCHFAVIGYRQGWRTVYAFWECLKCRRRSKTETVVFVHRDR